MTRPFSGLSGWVTKWGAKPELRTYLLVLLGFCALTAILTYPVALNILSHPAGSTDVYEYMWELWWAKRSLIDLHISPASVTALYHPYGTHHPLLLLDAYLMFTSLPIVLLLSPAAAINLHLLSSYALTGFTTYLLCWHLTRRHWPAFLGGVIFAFSPFRSDRAAHGIITLALTYGLPLYVLFLLRLFERPRWRNAAFCGIALGFSILSSFLHLVHFVVPFTLVFLAYQHFADRRRLYRVSFVKGLAVAVGLAFLMVVPAYIPLLQARLAGELEYFSRFGVLSHSSALLALVVPPYFHLLVRQIEPLRMFVQELLPGRYSVLYLGLVSLSLAIIGMLKGHVRLWIVLMVVSAVLALGPLLHVTDDLVEVTLAGRTGFVVLPGALLTALPFYEWARDPSRFGELAVFSLSVLASFGVLALCRLHWARIARAGVLSALLALILLDYWLFVPFPTQALDVPAFYNGLQADTSAYGILDLGTERFNHEGMYFQTTHQHPLARGFIYRYPSGTEYYQEFLEQLASPESDIINSGRFVEILAQLDIRLVVLHKLSEVTVTELDPYLKHNLGDPTYEDRQIVVYSVPSDLETVVPAFPLLLLGEQWHPPELIDGVPSRWMVNDGVVYVRVEEEGSYQLSLTAHPFQRPRHLQVFVEDELVQEYDVGGMQSYLTPAFVLRSGEWTPIRLHVPEGCEVPSEVVEGQEDDRCLSMLFQGLDVRVAEVEA
jgi:hypothetical protein